MLVRRVPAQGEVGCPGSCPLCTSTSGRPSPPCLACRDEIRARLADMQLTQYMERALN